MIEDGALFLMSLGKVGLVSARAVLAAYFTAVVVALAILLSLFTAAALVHAAAMRPDRAWARRIWLAVITFLPVLGPLLYLARSKNHPLLSECGLSFGLGDLKPGVREEGAAQEHPGALGIGGLLRGQVCKARLVAVHDPVDEPLKLIPLAAGQGDQLGVVGADDGTRQPGPSEHDQVGAVQPAP
jgi:hypothetical protein